MSVSYRKTRYVSLYDVRFTFQAADTHISYSSGGTKSRAVSQTPMSRFPEPTDVYRHSEPYGQFRGCHEPNSCPRISLPLLFRSGLSAGRSHSLTSFPLVFTSKSLRRFEGMSAVLHHQSDCIR